MFECSHMKLILSLRNVFNTYYYSTITVSSDVYNKIVIYSYSLVGHGH